MGKDFEIQPSASHRNDSESFWYISNFWNGSSESICLFINATRGGALLEGVTHGECIWSISRLKQKKRKQRGRIKNKQQCRLERRTKSGILGREEILLSHMPPLSKITFLKYISVSNEFDYISCQSGKLVSKRSNRVSHSGCYVFLHGNWQHPGKIKTNTVNGLISWTLCYK